MKAKKAAILNEKSQHPSLKFSTVTTNVSLNKNKVYLKYLFLLKIIYFYREEEREGNINVWLHLKCPLLETCLGTQACTLTGNPTGDPLNCEPALNPLSHTSQS